jgi:biopolymer transport protein ExbB
MESLFAKGGPMMWPLLLCSILSLTVILERAIFWWRMGSSNDGGVVDDILHRTDAGDFDAAVSLAEASTDSTARVLAAGLAHRAHGLRESMQVAAEDAIGRMKRGLNILDTIITMAPLLGILGTVLGIIQSFDLLGQSGIQDPQAVTGGIAQALISTAAGLSVALVTLVPFNMLVARVQSATSRLENVTTQLEVAYRKGAGRHDATE